MFLHSLASAVPPTSFTQTECWGLAESIGLSDLLRSRSMQLLERVLTSDSGISKRHFGALPIEDIFSRDAERLNRDFESLAPALGEEALRKALDLAGMSGSDLDALFVCTCTGYLCPGLSSYLAESVGLRPDAYLQDLVGLGCGAAIPTMRSAANFLAAHPDATVAVLPIEICSSAFFVNDEPGVLISLCLFGDGASASIWQGAGHSETGQLMATGFDTVHLPEHREKIRFVNEQGKLKNKLHRSVPQLAGAAVEHLFARRLVTDTTPTVISHGGGRDVIEEIDRILGGTQSLTATREILHDYGNMSSPSVLFALERHLANESDADNLWLTSFGAGFACHSVSLKRQ